MDWCLFISLISVLSNKQFSTFKKMKYFLLLLIFSYHVTLNAQQLTALEVIELIKENVTCEWEFPTVDTIKAGDGSVQVTGIVTTFMATMEVLKKAVKENCNLIITHEPTFYDHFDDLARLGSDPVQQAKLDYIKEHNLVIFRFHDYIHRTEPDGIYEGVIDALGWKDYQKSNSYVFEIPKRTLSQLREDLANFFQSGIVRGLGDKDQVVSKVGLAVGAAGSMTHIYALQNLDIDVLLIGEGLEWETIPYFQDANTLGFKKGLIILGHADSEEAGMKYCAKWLEKFITSAPIKFIPSGNPMWGASN
jgi:putative NIF3 family GTP cyclohydrolase 1 type 2